MTLYPARPSERITASDPIAWASKTQTARGDAAVGGGRTASRGGSNPLAHPFEPGIDPSIARVEVFVGEGVGIVEVRNRRPRPEPDQRHLDAGPVRERRADLRRVMGLEDRDEIAFHEIDRLHGQRAVLIEGDSAREGAPQGRIGGSVAGLAEEPRGARRDAPIEKPSLRVGAPADVSEAEKDHAAHSAPIHALIATVGADRGEGPVDQGARERLTPAVSQGSELHPVHRVGCE